MLKIPGFVLQNIVLGALTTINYHFVLENLKLIYLKLKQSPAFSSRKQNLRPIKAKLTLDLRGWFWSSGDHQMSSNPVYGVSGNILDDALNMVDDEKCARHNIDYDIVVFV